MIPQIIHYCWFGRGEMPKLMKKCIKSWKKCCPDWQIICWNEDNFDIHSTVWTKQAYEAKKYAFVSDYVRLKVLYEMGGVYLDTDQELRKPLTPFLQHRVFLGFMDSYEVGSGVIGAEEKHPMIADLLQYYKDRQFLCDNGNLDLTPNTIQMTKLLVERGMVIEDKFQKVADVAVYPQTYFSPTSCIRVENCISKATVAIHHMYGSWHSEQGRKDMKRAKFHTTKFYRTWEKMKILPQKMFRKVFGDDAMEALKRRIGKRR